MFETIPEVPEDVVLGLVREFQAMTHDPKVNLGVGIYLTDEGTSKAFDAVSSAEKEMAELRAPKDYRPIGGDPDYLLLAQKLVLGDLLDDSSEDLHLGSVQTAGGTSALNLGARLLKQAGYRTLFLPNPTWPNHAPIFKELGMEIHFYSYPLFEGLKAIPEKAIVILHAACHNPTGIDPEKDEWKEVFEHLLKKQAILFFDNAYQGFGRNLEDDAWAMQESLRRGLKTVIATSFSKNFGLYGERVGLLTLATESTREKDRVMSFMKSLIRTTYSNPPMHGSEIVKRLLSTPSLKKAWREELEAMQNRLVFIREELASLFPGITKGKGLFFLSDFSPEQIAALKNEGILMLKTGRINLSGLNRSNLDYVKKVFKKFR